MVLAEIVVGIFITFSGYCVLQSMITVVDGCVIFCNYMMPEEKKENKKEYEMKNFV